MTGFKKSLLVLAVVLGAAAIVSTPPTLDYVPPVSTSLDLQSMLQEPLDQLIPGTEKRIVWHDGERPTGWSVVALHGFSASRQETAPLAEMVAASLGANLFETRFDGHGLKEDGLVDVEAERWLDDVAEALTIGHAIGNKLVVIAMSNGAALAASMLDHPTMQGVDALIMLSPNFAPADPNAAWITRPAGPLLLRLVSGSTRSWEGQNERQELYWTTSYPIETVVEVMRVVNRAHKTIAEVAAPRLQILYSPGDRVISIPALESAIETIRSPQKEIVKVPETGSPFNHVIVGDIISPDNTLPLAAKITDFILRPAP